MLEGVFQRELQEAGIGGVVLKKLRSRDLAALRSDTLVGRIAPRGLIEQIKGIRAELQILFAEGDEVLEQRHINRGISGSVNLIGPAAKEGYRRGLIGYDIGSRDQIPGQRILERTRVVPVVPRLDPCRAGCEAGIVDGVGYTAGGVGITDQDRSCTASVRCADARINGERRASLRCKSKTGGPTAQGFIFPTRLVEESAAHTKR